MSTMRLIAEAAAAFGDDDDVNCGVDHLRDRVLRQARETGPRCSPRGRFVAAATMRSVWREKRRNLQHIGDLGGHRGFVRFVDVGHDGTPKRRFDRTKHPQASVMPGPRTT